ncbi:unnamed protein product, partial [Rotaria sp. Silwood1]
LDNLLQQTNLPNDIQHSLEIIHALKRLWTDTEVQLWYKEHGHQIDSHHHYYLTRLIDILTDDYFLSKQDILHVRIILWLIDVYSIIGHTYSTNKWFRHFEDASAIIFMVDLCCYDQIPYDMFENPMHESLEMFHSLCSSRFLNYKPIFLCLNKKDLFAKKIIRSSLRQCFPEYNGRDEYGEASQYILSKFLQMNEDRCKKWHYRKKFWISTHQVNGFQSTLFVRIAL